MDIINKANINISNSLSFLRILLVIPMVYFIAVHENIFVLYLSIAGMITDWLDGFFARKLNQITELGKVLDPVADKILIGGSVLALHLYQGFPLWLMLVIIFRDVFIVIGALFIYGKQKKITSSNWPGKISVTLIAVAIVSFIIGWRDFFNYAVIAALASIIISAGIYAWVFLQKIRKKDNE